MGMKATSGHFSGKVSAGGAALRLGAKFRLNIQLFAKMPSDRSQILHIMRKAEGHLPNTHENQQLLIKLTEDRNNFVGYSIWGNEIYAKTVNGIQYWAYVRDGIIQDGGANTGKPYDFFKISKKGETHK